MRPFLTIWAGQFASLIGTGMTRFALLIWAYQQTESPLTVAVLGLSSFVPLVLVSPFAGVWTDRLDRRLVMVLADLGAGLMTAALLALFAFDRLLLWHLYLAAGLAGFFEAFQYPAYTALSSRLLARAQYGRAAGLRATADYGAQGSAPILAGTLLPLVGIAAVMAIDLITFGVALATLLVARIPAAQAAGSGRK